MQRIDEIMKPILVAGWDTNNLQNGKLATVDAFRTWLKTVDLSSIDFELAQVEVEAVNNVQHRG